MFYSFWKYKCFYRTLEKKMILMEHSQICMQQLKISFFPRQTHKKTFILKNFSKGVASRPPYTQDILPLPQI